MVPYTLSAETLFTNEAQIVIVLDMGDASQSTNRAKVKDAALAIVSKLLPMSDVIVEVWQVVHSLYEDSSAVGIYEVLDHETTLELENKSGTKATLSKSQRVRYLQNNVIAYQDQVWGDGDILLDYKCSPGVEVDRYKPAEMTYILISLRDVKQKGEMDNLEISWKAKGAFVRNKERWTTQISHRTQQLKLNLIFPKSRRPISARLIEQMSRRQHPTEPDTIHALPDGRWQIQYEIKKPKLYERYIVEWEW